MVSFTLCLIDVELVIATELEDILNYEDNDELDKLSMDLSEFNYYHNTNK